MFCPLQRVFYRVFDFFFYLVSQSMLIANGLYGLCSNRQCLCTSATKTLLKVESTFVKSEKVKVPLIV